MVALVLLLAVPTSAGAIANGLETFRFPSTVALLTRAPSGSLSAFCAGTLIGCSTVLTDAACVCTAGTGEDCQEGSAQLTDPALIEVFIQNHPTVGVSSIHVPPAYVFRSTADIAVVILETPVQGIRPTPINAAVDVPFGTPGIVVGYGISNASVPDAGIKREGALVTSPCDPALAPAVTDDENLCWTFPGTAAAGPPGTDSNPCPGDSGGPLFTDFGSGLRVAGVTSGGPVACHTADNPFDTDVFVNRTFVQGIAGADLNNTSCGPLPQVGEAGTTIIPFSGTLDDTFGNRPGGLERRVLPASSSERPLALQPALHGGSHTVLAGGTGGASDTVSFEVPPGTELLRANLNGTFLAGTDLDLSIRSGAPPTATEFDCASELLSSFESCEIASPEPGMWNALVTLAAGPAGPYQLTVTTFECSADVDGDLVCDSADNCVHWPNADQADTDGNGIGDECECGDQTGDGVVNVSDILAINDVIFEIAPASALCDTNDDDACNVADILGVNARIFGAPAHCARYPAP